MPRASVISAVIVKPGEARRRRRAWYTFLVGSCRLRIERRDTGGGLDPFTVVHEQHAALGDGADAVDGERAVGDFAAVEHEVAAGAGAEVAEVGLAQERGGER